MPIECRMKLNSATVVETSFGDIRCADADSASIALRVIADQYGLGKEDAKREIRKVLGVFVPC